MKTKILIILVSMFISSVAIAQEKTVKAFYTGYDEESQSYSFEDAEENYIEFQKVKSELIKKFKLKTAEFVNEAFLITYIVKEVGDDDDTYEEYSIVKLQPTILTKQTREDESDDDDE